MRVRALGATLGLLLTVSACGDDADGGGGAGGGGSSGTGAATASGTETESASVADATATVSSSAGSGESTGSGGGATTCGGAPLEREFSWITQDDGPTTLYAYLPEQPRGIVVALHGTGGSSESLAIRKVEWARFFRAASERSLALLVPESEQRSAPRQWDNAPDAENPDIERLARAIDTLAAAGDIDEATPIYLVGMSRGGGVVPIYGAVLTGLGYPIRAAAVYCAGDSGAYEEDEVRTPTTFQLMARDQTADNPEGVEDNAERLRERGVDAEVFIQQEALVCPTRFARIPGISEEDSAAIWEGLVDAGTIAPDGRVAVESSDADAGGKDVPGLPSAFAAYEDAVGEQLRVVAAQHAFYSDTSEAVLTFLEEHR